MNRQFQRSLGVTHLKEWSAESTLLGHEHRALCCFSDHGFGPSPDSRSSSRALWSRDTGQTFWVSSAIDLHGLRAVDVARKPAGHRSLSERQTRNTLSS